MKIAGNEKMKMAMSVAALALMMLSGSAKADPIIDGVIGANEWIGASVVDIRLGKDAYGPGDRVGSLSVMVNANYLYALFNLDGGNQNAGDTIDARPNGVNGQHGENISISISSDQTGATPNMAFQLALSPNSGNWNPNTVPGYVANNPATWSSGAIDGYQSYYAFDNVQQFGLPAGELPDAFTSYGTGHRVTEMAISLAHLNPAIPSTWWIGGTVAFDASTTYWTLAAQTSNHVPITISGPGGSPVPTPGSMVLLGLALGGFFLIRRFKPCF